MFGFCSRLVLIATLAIVFVTGGSAFFTFTKGDIVFTRSFSILSHIFHLIYVSWMIYLTYFLYIIRIIHSVRYPNKKLKSITTTLFKQSWCSNINYNIKITLFYFQYGESTFSWTSLSLKASAEICWNTTKRFREDHIRNAHIGMNRSKCVCSNAMNSFFNNYWRDFMHLPRKGSHRGKCIHFAISADFDRMGI